MLIFKGWFPEQGLGGIYLCFVLFQATTGSRRTVQSVGKEIPDQGRTKRGREGEKRKSSKNTVSKSVRNTAGSTSHARHTATSHASHEPHSHALPHSTQQQGALGLCPDGGPAGSPLSRGGVPASRNHGMDSGQLGGRGRETPPSRGQSCQSRAKWVGPSLYRTHTLQSAA